MWHRVKKAVLTYFVILCLLSSVFLIVLTFGIQPARSDWTWTWTIYIRADGSVDPATAPISTVDNITYTLTDNIVGDVPYGYSAIVVEKDDIIVDGADYTLEGESTYDSKGMLLSERTNITIRNMTIQRFYDGIDIRNSSEVNIHGVDVIDNEGGITLSHSNNNSISRNNLTNNRWAIGFDKSRNNTISRNNITKNGGGIGLLNSSNNLLRNNIMVDCEYNFYIVGWNLLDYRNDIDTSNIVNGKPAYYIVDQRDLVINSQTHPLVGYLALINCTNAKVEGLTLTNNGQGLLLAFTTNSTVFRNNITNNYDGFWLTHSSNNSICKNDVENNTNGIILWKSSYNTISENDITDNEIGEYGSAVSLVSSSNNSITENNITEGWHGIGFIESSRNSISGNDITNNVYGLRIKESSRNKFYHNNFIDNSHQVSFYNYQQNSKKENQNKTSYTNFWDNGLEGNYWDTYIGVDLDPDGIGDTWYEVDENNTDHYPLMGMFSNFNATSEHHVQTICNSTISDFQFNGTAICFNVTGEDGTVGFCRTCIPRALMNETYKVFVNGTEVSHTLLTCSNSTHNYLYFTYNHSTQEVVIIPEFPSFLLLPLFMISTLLAVILCRRKHSMK